MSPQSTLTVVTLSAHNDVNSNIQNMSNTELAQAAATAFSKNRRLDAELPPSSAVEENPLDSGYQSSRKRKVREDDFPSNNSFFNCSVNFLSAIFNDIAKAQGQTSSSNLANPTEQIHQSSPGHNYPDKNTMQPNRKKSRLSRSSSLSRCHKSFKNLPLVLNSGSAATVSTEATQVTDLSSHSSSPDRDDSDFEPESPIPTNDHVIVSDHYSNAANIIDHVLDVGLFLPTLPATVSQHSCASTTNNRLTQTAVHAVQVLETSLTTLKSETNIEVSKMRVDSYGWFVETDEDDILRNRAEAIADASDKARTNSIDLSFSAVTSPKSFVDDDDLEWAKAADTIDDVLGDFF